MNDYDVNCHPLDTASSTHGTGPEHLTNGQRNRLIASLFSRPGENPTINLVQSIIDAQVEQEDEKEQLLREKLALQDEGEHQKYSTRLCDSASNPIDAVVKAIDQSATYRAPHKQDNPPASPGPAELR